MPCYAVLGATGRTGQALLSALLSRPQAQIHAFCRNKRKLADAFPDLDNLKQMAVFEGNVTDTDLMAKCVQGCQAIFLVISTNDNVPGCRMSQDTVLAVLAALEGQKKQGSGVPPRLVLLSSCTVDEHLSRHTPWLLRQILLLSASQVYHDLMEAEKLLRAQESWLTTIYMKPGALALDKARGYALSFTDEDSPVTYEDLAGAMIEAAEDQGGVYDGRNVSVVNTNGKPVFPKGTPLCIVVGLMRHFFPVLHPYLPTGLGP
ncbi:hypothetical protein COCSADRAFT_81643 [Bipolaris sorokiniana ND90Pr]|uniref:CcxP n=2 Tax=Cochliobolus sativus TaxID=45130 RepID=A0A4D6Q995_COCSA|nr:uncharacterized protein COCSADRAFT_81643 [Bipolaris sorokiniana ND90Pr]EMD66890.1 hypothetical protein COCSADRAFT_81643 [Bipolaris sorokiniana ND90Pr]QCF41207.1 CcxP [Bipolaris sorokiniana]